MSHPATPAPDAIPFNVNGHVWVKLADLGRRRHREQWEELTGVFRPVGQPPVPLPSWLEYTPPEEDPDGWSRWQLWELMRLFGPSCGNGLPVPFETEIRLSQPGRF